ISVRKSEPFFLEPPAVARPSAAAPIEMRVASYTALNSRPLIKKISSRRLKGVYAQIRAVSLLCQWLNHEQVVDAHDRLVSRERGLDSSIDLTELGHLRQRHSVFQSIAALPRPNNN